MTTPPRRSPLLRGRGRAGLRVVAPMVNIHGCSPVPAAVPAHQDPSSISPDAWWRLEVATFSVMDKIQPTVSSQHLRARVIDYVQRIFRLHHDGYQVISYGSVPFKTYLPDGDIDLTIFCTAISDEKLENEVCAILKAEEQRKDSEFEVKDVKYVPAEVKLVKCKVQNIAVDISVNQIGGPNKLYFLKKIDQNLGKNNLLRRSIMLIKHWCYYESRILGSQHGLISTYALETLVLYIFHIFHKSLDGPLAVLYRFLDYYSKFDWDNKGISLFGPISLSSLPELITEPPDTRDDGFLSREAFLKGCAEAFRVTPRNSEKNPQVFSKKFLNIVDPLKQSNNLGRSVSKGNFRRIRDEFRFGACKLGKILQAPACFSANEINRFFWNTLKKADVLVSSSDDVLMTANVTNDSVSPGLDVERVHKGSLPNDSCDVLSNQFSYIKISDSNNDASVKQMECSSLAECKEIKSASGGLPDSDATSHASTDSVSTRNGCDFSGASLSPSETETCTLQSVRDHWASSPSSQVYNYPMLAKINGAVVPGPLYQTDDHMAFRAHGTGGTYFPYSNLPVDRPHVVHANKRANDHGTTAPVAPSRPASSSPPSSTPRQPRPPPPQPASPSHPFAYWPGGGAQGRADCRGHGSERNAGGVVKGGGMVGNRGDAGVGAEGPAAPTASAHSKARLRRPRDRGRR